MFRDEVDGLAPHLIQRVEKLIGIKMYSDLCTGKPEMLREEVVIKLDTGNQSCLGRMLMLSFTLKIRDAWRRS